MKKVLIIAGIFIGLMSCKYDDSYLDPKLESKAYFASNLEYTRSVIVGEGLYFKIGAAASGSLQSPVGATVDMVIDKSVVFEGDKQIIPDTHYNSSELSGTIHATFGDNFLGYFTVKMDSTVFLNDPKSLTGNYIIPVKITGTSLSSVNEERSSVQVGVKYMSKVDGYYLYKTTIRREVDGIMTDWSLEERYPNESDNSTFRLETVAPFKVMVTPAVNSFLNGMNFELTVDDDDEVAYGSIDGGKNVQADGENQYDRRTRDFTLNYKYVQSSDTVYHVSQELIFRNRMVDGVNQTRDYLSYFN